MDTNGSLKKMKARILNIQKALLWIVLTLLTHTIQAQPSDSIQSELESYYPKKIINRLELLAGANFIYPKEKYDENRVAKFGYTFGLNLVHEIPKSLFDLNLKLGYEQKGWNSVTYSPNNDFNPPATQKFVRSETINYLTASVYSTYRFSNFDKLSMGFGLYGGYLFNERMKYSLYLNDSLVSNYNGRPDPYVSYKKLDFGVVLIISYRIKISERILKISLENNVGLIDISKQENAMIKNRTYCLHIGIPLINF